MINGNKINKTEKEYRNTIMDSSSSLKMFSLDKRKYYRVFIERSKEDTEDETKASVTGRVVETVLLEPHLFDSRFAMSVCASSPTGLMLAFVEALYDATIAATDEEGNITKSFEDLSREAYLASGFKIKYEAVIGKFAGSDAEIYFNEIVEIRSKGLTIVTAQDVTNAENIVEALRTNFVTRDIILLESDDKWTVHNQFQVEGYSVEGHLFKSMIDKIIVNCKKKTIDIYDLKCVWAVEGFYTEYYLFRRSYIQAYLYWRAIVSLTTDVKHEWCGYQVNFPQFIVCDSINYYNPLIYALNTHDIDDAQEGFEYKGKKYPGVLELIGDLKWALEENVWNISRKNYLSNGIVPLKNND